MIVLLVLLVLVVIGLCMKDVVRATPGGTTKVDRLTHMMTEEHCIRQLFWESNEHDPGTVTLIDKTSGNPYVVPDGAVFIITDVMICGIGSETSPPFGYHMTMTCNDVGRLSFFSDEHHPQLCTAKVKCSFTTGIVAQGGHVRFQLAPDGFSEGADVVYWRWDVFGYEDVDTEP
jgi:hypothetical protein